MNLYQASRQWQARPADERFWNLQDMLTACQYHRDSAATATIQTNRLTAIADNSTGDVLLSGPTGAQARLTHWAFGQLANRVGAPADYLRSLPADMAAQNLTYGLSQAADDSQSRALFHKNGSLVCRCVTSEQYSRIFNADVISRLLPLSEQGWRVPPARPAMHDQPGARPATAADVLSAEHSFGLSVKIGDMIAPAGLYASDHDMFAFMVNEDVRIDDGTDAGLARGFFVTNSEVGAAALKFTRFLYRHCCGNHICWGAEQVREIRIIHRGRADHRYRSQLIAELREYADSSAVEDENRIKATKRCVLGNTKDEVLDLLFGKRILPRRDLLAAYEMAETESAENRAGSPKTAWGFAQGITRLSQNTPFADERNKLDRAGGKVLELAF